MFRCGAKLRLLLSAQVLESQMPRVHHQPGGYTPSRLVQASRFPPKAQEYFLEDFLRPVAFAQNARQRSQQARGKAIVEVAQRTRIALAHPNK
jgi:hypothetical protein